MLMIMKAAGDCDCACVCVWFLARNQGGLGGTVLSRRRAQTNCPQTVMRCLYLSNEHTGEILSGRKDSGEPLWQREVETLPDWSVVRSLIMREIVLKCTLVFMENLAPRSRVKCSFSEGPPAFPGYREQAKPKGADIGHVGIQAPQRSLFDSDIPAVLKSLVLTAFPKTLFSFYSRET